jgi:hypothetical protein
MARENLATLILFLSYWAGSCPSLHNSDSCKGVLMDDAFRRERCALIRELAENAGPWVKDRLLKLANRYEDQEEVAIQHPPRKNAVVWPGNHASER